MPLLFLVALLACGGHTPASPSPSPETTEDQAACAACIESGGTWQPEASACTQGCAIMDISCYRDACPAACSPERCGSCFSEDACKQARCTWHQQAEAQWCTE